MFAVAQDRPLPGNLDLKALKLTKSQSRAAVNADGVPLGWTTSWGSFDLDPADPEGMFIMNLKTGSPFPAVRKSFLRRPIKQVATDYLDPNTNLHGDIYSFALPDGSLRYVMFVPNDPASQTGSSIVFYDSAGMATLYQSAFFAPKTK